MAVKKPMTRKELKELFEQKGEQALLDIKAKNQRVIDFVSKDDALEGSDAAQQSENALIDAILTGTSSSAAAEELKAFTETLNATFKTTLKDTHTKKLTETTLAALKGENGLSVRMRVSEAGELSFEAIKVKAKAKTDGTASTAGGGKKSKTGLDTYVVAGVPCASAGAGIEEAQKWVKANNGVEFKTPDTSFSKPRYLADLGKKYKDMDIRGVIEIEREEDARKVCAEHKLETGTIDLGEGDKKVARLTVPLFAYYEAVTA